MANLWKKIFNFGGLLTVRKFSSLLSWQETRQRASRHENVAESRLLDNRKWSKILDMRCPYIEHIWDLKACFHSDTLSPTRPHLLIVSLPLGTLVFVHFQVSIISAPRHVLVAEVPVIILPNNFHSLLLCSCACWWPSSPWECKPHVYYNVWHTVGAKKILRKE